MSSQQTTVLLATTLVVNALHIERLTCSKPDCLHAFAFCHGSSYIYLYSPSKGYNRIHPSPCTLTRRLALCPGTGNVQRFL